MKFSTFASIATAFSIVLPRLALAQPQQDAGQPPMVASQPVPDTAVPSPGVPSDQAVNPAPGAAGPYVGAGPGAFYDVDARIGRFEQEAGALAGRKRREAQAALTSIRAEEKTQIARHGQLRDWDRENLNYRLDQLVRQFPSLGPSSGVAQPPAVE